MRDHSIEHAVVAARPVGGLAAAHLDSFATDLVARGYAPKTIQSKAQLLRAFDRWVVRHHVAVGDLDERAVDAFLSEPRGHRIRRRGGAATLRCWLTHLRTRGVIVSSRPAPEVSALAPLAHQYERYLRAERGLCPTTVQTHLRFFREFLSGHVGEAPSSVRALSAADVTVYMRRHAHAASPGSAKVMVWALRTLLHFLFQRGETGIDLSTAVLTVPDWRLATIPKSLSPDDVERLLAGCNHETATGRRDRAILVLLARLGMRAGEVVALELEDIDWRASTITIRGKKGLRHDRFPLLAEVGQALVSYLRRDRPHSATRRVFLCMRAPRRGFAGPGAVTTIVRRALTRAELHPPVRGAHLLRHSLATQLLRQGASLGEIGEVLRHRGASTTEIYAKVDLDSLRSVVQPWPAMGGDR